MLYYLYDNNIHNARLAWYRKLSNPVIRVNGLTKKIVLVRFEPLRRLSNLMHSHVSQALLPLPLLFFVFWLNFGVYHNSQSRSRDEVWLAGSRGSLSLALTVLVQVSFASRLLCHCRLGGSVVDTVP